MKLVSCILCGCDDHQVIDHVSQNSINLGKKEFIRDITNVICKNCGLIFNNPKLDSEDLEEMYSFTTITKIQQTKTDINNSLPKIGDIEKEQFDFISKFIGRSNLNGLKVMEVGCSLGNSLRPFYDAGAQVYGTEPSKTDAEYAQKVNHVKTNSHFFSKDSFPPETFDIVTIFYVLEHVENPFYTLEAIHKQLKQNALLYLEVPNTSRPFVGLDPFFSMGHLFSFSAITISAFLKKSKFKIKKIEQIGGINDTGKNFPRLRVIAQKTEVSSDINYNGEFEKMLKIMKKYSSERHNLILGINELLNPLIERWIKNNDKVMIFGAGSNSSELLKNTNIKKTNIIGFVDNNLSFQGQTFCGLPVYAPSDFTKIKPNVIIICARGWERQIWANLVSERANGIEVIPLYETDLMEN